MVMWVSCDLLLPSCDFCYHFQVIRCTQIAAVKCLEVTEIIKKALSKLTSKTEYVLLMPIRACTHTHTHTHTHTFHRDVSSILHTRQPVTEVPVSECVGGEGVEEVRGVDDVMEVDGMNPAHKSEIISLVSMTLDFITRST